MDILDKKQKIILIIVVVCILFFIGYYIINKTNNLGYVELETQNNETNNNIGNNSDIIEEEMEDEDIVIHVTGAVKKQGIVKVKQGSRISDIIDAAGGITDKADLSKINLAYAIQDGQKIYIPSITDKEDINTVTEDAGTNIIKEENANNSKKEKVNINKASQTELETLSGIGPSTALKIINYRNENGNFKKIEDLKNVPGIGESKFENIKEDICVK